MKKALFITVRKDSSRLPGKTMLKILGVPVLGLVVRRAKLAKKFDGVIVCTTTRSMDDEVVAVAKSYGANTYRGPLEDKLARWHGAAQQYGVDYIVTFDGDDLFCDPKLLDMGVEQIEKRDLDFIESPTGMICGAFTYAFTSEALKKVCEIKASEDTEMMWTYFKDTGLFKCGQLEDVPRIYFNNQIRATLDYPEDMDFFTKIFEHFQCPANDVGLDVIAEYIVEHPEIAAINIGRQKEFLANQRAKTHLKIK